MNIYNNDLIEFLVDVSNYFPKKITMVAVGGTALTLLGIKDSTIDIDFDIPSNDDYLALIKTFQLLSFKQQSNFTWETGPYAYRFDLFKLGYIFCTQLLDPSDQDAVLIFENKKLKLFSLNPYDLVITKIFRSTERDLDDSVLCFQEYDLDIIKLTKRFIKTFDVSMHNFKNAKYNLSIFLAQLNLNEGVKNKCKNLLRKWH